MCFLATERILFQWSMLKNRLSVCLGNVAVWNNHVIGDDNIAIVKKEPWKSYISVICTHPSNLHTALVFLTNVCGAIYDLNMTCLQTNKLQGR